MTPDVLIGSAAAMVPLLRKNATEGERLRRLPDDTVRALEEAGLFRMLQPSNRGGYETDAQTISRVLTLIASGCASTAWVMMIYSSVAQLAELLSKDALFEIYADAHPKIAGVFGRSGQAVRLMTGTVVFMGAPNQLESASRSAGSAVPAGSPVAAAQAMHASGRIRMASAGR